MRPPPTLRLYYDDSTLHAFRATVVATRLVNGAPHVALDRSAFYPTSGGQPHDLGVLTPAPEQPVRVSDVFDEDEVVWHVTDRALDEGTMVEGQIDEARRFDHRQQHTGQHVLSASLATTTGAVTRSVHFGTEICTVDVDRELSPQQVALAEADANRVVFEDRPVSVRYADATELAGLGLRKPTDREGTVRLVEVTGHDLSACGGTHVTRTGEVGLVVIGGAERFKGGLRVSFVCGGRALRQHRFLRDTLDASARLLSVASGDLPATVAKLLDDARAARRAGDDLLTRLVALEAESLERRFEAHADCQLLVAHVPTADPGSLRKLASTLVLPAERVVVLTGGESPHGLVVARSADCSRVDAVALARAVTAAVGGKAGGRADLAQGGGLSHTTDVRAVVVAALE